MAFDLHGTTALISGGSQGIGKVIADLLASRGARLSLCARTLDRLEAAARDLEERHATPCHIHAADLSRPDAPDKWVAEAVSALGKVDILVNVAGASVGGAFLDLDDAAWDGTIALKLMGYIRCARAVIPHMRAAGTGGSIVNILGIAGRQPLDNFMVGGVCNAALMNFTKALSNEMAGSGIRVNGINPGITQTERWTGIIDSLSKANSLDKSALEAELVRNVPLARPADPLEIAEAVAFLASRQAAYITGVTLDVDGGYFNGV